MAPSPSAFPHPSRGTVVLAALAALVAALFVINLTGLPNVTDNEWRMGGYVLDVIQNGHWAVQTDLTGDVVSKPPMYIWLATLATLPAGRVSHFSVYLPSALSTLVISALLFWVGRARFGWRAGFLAAFCYLISPLGDRQVATARYDGLFALWVLLAALAAYRAWTRGNGWTWFWLAAAGATLVKGPLGILLGAAGLLAVPWERRSGHPLPARGSHRLGIVLFLAIAGGWFAWAYVQMGPPLVDKMIGRELVRHAVLDGKGAWPGQELYKPVVSFLGSLAPWSVFACLGFWRGWRHPSADPEERRFERFLLCFFLAGLVVFGLASHQRGRLIYPLLPAAALVAGRELARWTNRWSDRTLFRATAVVVAVTLPGLAVYHRVLLGSSRAVQDSLALESMAETVRRQVGDHFPLMHVSPEPEGDQFYLNTRFHPVSADEAAELLRGPRAAFAVTGDLRPLSAALGADATRLAEIGRWSQSRNRAVYLVGNRPRLEWADRMAFLLGPLRVETDGMRLAASSESRLDFARTGARGSVTVTNRSATPLRLALGLKEREAEPQQRLLAPGEAWRWEPSPGPG